MVAYKVPPARGAHRVLDGEVALYDHQLVSRFEWFRHTRPTDLAMPPLLMVFDCPYARGMDLRDRPLHVRRNVIG